MNHKPKILTYSTGVGPFANGSGELNCIPVAASNDSITPATPAHSVAIFGANGVGKSAFLDPLRQLTHGSTTYSYIPVFDLSFTVPDADEVVECNGSGNGIGVQPNTKAGRRLLEKFPSLAFFYSGRRDIRDAYELPRLRAFAKTITPALQDLDVLRYVERGTYTHGIKHAIYLMGLATRYPIIIVDDFGDGMHPFLAAALFKRVAKDTQLICTTHHATLIAALHPEQVYLIDQSQQGAASISSAVEYRLRQNESSPSHHFRNYMGGRYSGVPWIVDQEVYPDSGGSFTSGQFPNPAPRPY